MHVEMMLWALAPGSEEQPRWWGHLLPGATQCWCRGGAGCWGAAAGSPNQDLLSKTCVCRLRVPRAATRPWHSLVGPAAPKPSPGGAQPPQTRLKTY